MNSLIRISREILFLAIGLLVTLLFLTFVLLSIPVYIYRWIICRFVAPYFHPTIGKAVTSFGMSFGNDYVSKDFHKKASRSTLVSNATIYGTIPYEDVVHYLHTLIKLSKVGIGRAERLRYPELQQYVGRWMGFLFWKQDSQFNLDNHLKLHKIDEYCTKAEANQFVIQVIEDLLNKPFVPKRSPWEFHVIHGYRNDGLEKLSKANHGDDSGEMTVLILRSHHVLADGFSLLSALLEGIGEQSSTVLKLPTVVKHKKSVCRRTLSYLQLPVRFLYDIGSAYANEHKPQMNSPLHSLDSKKQWKNFHGRSELIPINRLKDVKGKFGVAFTAILYSCMSAALSEYLEGKTEKKMARFRKKVKYLPVAATLSLAMPGSRDKMRNSWTASVMDLPIRHSLHPKERLRQCEKNYNEAKDKILPYVTPYLVQAVGSHFAVVANKIMNNNGIASGLSNFIGPSTPLDFQGRKMLSAGFAFSNSPGVAGLGFQIMSYAGFLQIAATVEKGVMDKAELNQLLDCACEELNILHGMAVKDNISTFITIEIPPDAQ